MVSYWCLMVLSQSFWTVSEVPIVPMVSYSVLWCLLFSHRFSTVPKVSVVPMVSYSVLWCLLFSHCVLECPRCPWCLWCPTVSYGVCCTLAVSVVPDSYGNYRNYGLKLPHYQLHVKSGMLGGFDHVQTLMMRSVSMAWCGHL